MSELNPQEIYDNEGHINYDKVVEIVHLNVKNFLDAILEESFGLAKDPKYRTQANDASGINHDEALNIFLDSKHILVSEFYVELESRFYTSSSAIMRAMNMDASVAHTMDTDLIELALAIDQLVDRSVERHKDLIETLTLQLEELSFFAHQDFNIYCLQPQDFYKLFQNIIAPLSIPAEGKIQISKLIYQNISPNLNDFYMAMHNFLLDVDIKPAKSRASDKITEEASSDSAIMSMTTGQFYAPVEQEMWQREYEANNDYVEKQLNHTPEIIDEVAMDVYGPGKTGLDETTVSILLQPYRPNDQSNSSPAQRRQFIRALSSVQRVEAASNAIFQAEQIKTAAKRTLQEKGALDAEEIVDNDEKIIDFVCNIYQLILDDDSICQSMKVILSRLQISTIKLALIDFTFFQNAQHPARKLLNKLTSIGMSVDGSEELLFNKINNIVRFITDGFESDIDVFEHALSEIQLLDPESLAQESTQQEKEYQRRKLRSQRSAAKRVVIHTIKKFIRSKDIPNQILEFFLKCWAPHMAYIYMNHGRSSKAWRNAVRNLRRIIELSPGTHTLEEVKQYINQPNVFFNNLRNDLEYFESRNSEFDEALEEAEVWYLTYLKKIEEEAQALALDLQEQEPTEAASDEDQDNVIHLFKNLSPAEDNEDTVDTDSNHNKLEIHDEIEAHTASATEIDSESTAQDSIAEDDDDSSSVDLAPSHEHEDASEPESQIEQEKSHAEPEPEPELTIEEHLPESIIPGVWLEIYQGEDKAKRRLKFSKAIVETNHLVFSDRSGDYSLEIELATLLDDLSTGRSSLISESNRFDLALSSVISNIRSSQDETDVSSNK